MLRKPTTSEIEGYKKYLLEQTGMSISSIIEYARHIRDYLEYNNTITRDNVMRWLSKKIRKKHSNVAKFAMQHYLIYKNNKDVYDILKVTKPKKPSKLKIVREYNRESILRAINNIKHPVFRDIARIQAITGARIKEILTLKEENVIFNYSNKISLADGSVVEEKQIAAQIVGKGNYTRWLFMPTELTPILKKYVRGYKGYLFLDRSRSFDDFTFEMKIASIRRSYYRHLTMSMQDEGIKNFGTHDLRRNFATTVLYQGAPITVVRDLLGHKSVQTTEIYLPKYGNDAFIHLYKFQKSILKKKEATG
jgi:integrase